MPSVVCGRGTPGTPSGVITEVTIELTWNSGEESSWRGINEFAPHAGDDGYERIAVCAGDGLRRFAPPAVEEGDGSGDTLLRGTKSIDQSGESGWRVLAGERLHVAFRAAGWIA
jgi:hypothetical protein